MVKRKKEKQVTGKVPFYKKKGFWIALAVFAVLSMVFGDDEKEADVPEPKQERPAKVSSVADTTAEKEPEQRTEEVLLGELDEYGKKAFGDGYRKTGILWDIENAKYLDDGSYDADESPIEAINTEVFLSSSLTASFLKDVKDYLEEIKDVDFERVKISGDAMFTDQFGEEKELNAIYITLSKETVDKIKFENFDWKNLPNIADEFHAHQAMSDKFM